MAGGERREKHRILKLMAVKKYAVKQLQLRRKGKQFVDYTPVDVD